MGRKKTILTEKEQKAREKEYSKKYREIHKEEIKIKRAEKKEFNKNRRQLHYEKNKEHEKALHQIWLENNKEQQKQYSKDYWSKNKDDLVKEYNDLKLEVYEKLGGAICVICGDTEISHLTMDHINEDGKKDRDKGWNSWRLLRAIRDGKFPEDRLQNLRILCWNHNKARVRSYMDLPSKEQTSSQRHIHKLWIEAYNFFGPCKTCGETELKFMSISHIKNDGAEKRRNGEKQGPKLLSEFRKMGWPESLKEDYCFECFTCNCCRIGIRNPTSSSSQDSSNSEDSA
jgi:hypothetical protein